MKKVNLIVLAILFGASLVKANPVYVNVAQKVAENFYNQKYSTLSHTLTLAYTERASDLQPVYYVFNADATKGFVIVAAEDAAHPIIGYSDEGAFVIPASNNNVYFWLQQRKKEVIAIRAHNITATSDINDEWTTYASNFKQAVKHRVMAVKDSVLPLSAIYWDQSPYYNAYCPGGSVTGCVATAMAQIMRYWKYPSQGMGSNCYYTNYGQLCADFDTSNYVWSEMPVSIGDSNNQIAKLMYDCGVSVDMDYNPEGSGAQVMGGFPSAEYSFVSYFGYDANTINTAMYNGYPDSTFISLIENELNNKRLLQFQGFDSVYEGHSWVCDGYSATNAFHMNWGWSGYDNGYYPITNLNPVPYNFTLGIAVLYGIEPPPGALAVQQVSANAGITVYPNPSHGLFTVSITNYELGITNIEVSNVLGQQVYSTSYQPSAISHQLFNIDLSNQPKGVYLYRLLKENGEAISTGKLVVE